MKLSFEEADRNPLDQQPCKGWFYRGKVNAYYWDRSFRQDFRLMLLKRKSCAGCESCEWMHEYINEDMYNQPYDLSFVKHGALYKISATGGGLGFEYDDIEFTFNEVNE